MWTGRHISPGHSGVRPKKIVARYCNRGLTNGSNSSGSSCLISGSSSSESISIPQLLHVRRELKACMSFCEDSVIIKKLSYSILKCTVQLESEFHKASIICAVENLLRKMFKEGLIDYVRYFCDNLVIDPIFYFEPHLCLFYKQF